LKIKVDKHVIISNHIHEIIIIVGAICGRQVIEPPLSNIGEIVYAEINKIKYICENVKINEYVVIMLNYIYGIIIIIGAYLCVCPNKNMQIYK
jgi:hypothetical protein